MESVVWGNSFEKENDCWKLTNFCRDVVSTPQMDEFAHGATPAAFARQGNNPVVIILAVIAGVVASIMVTHAMRGGFSKKEEEPYGDVQFSEVVNSHELM
jgi:hypothetical protein